MIDSILLSRGYYVGYCDVQNMFGNPQAVSRWNTFYHYMITTHGFAEKPALEGMSRGGLIVYNWAIANPEKVACIYADAPVMDFKSWPAGFGNGVPSPPDWVACKSAYGFSSDDEARAYAGNPIDNLQNIADAKIPLYHVYGAADTEVRPDENTLPAKDSIESMGHTMTVMGKDGVGHVHGIEPYDSLLEFILQHTTN